LGGVGFGDGISSIAGQVTAQGIGVLATIVYSGVLSFIILKVIDVAIGLRVNEEQESEGLDLASHDERGYIL
jgi:Amt family ammonium transporter